MLLAHKTTSFEIVLFLYTQFQFYQELFHRVEGRIFLLSFYCYFFQDTSISLVLISRNFSFKIKYKIISSSNVRGCYTVFSILHILSRIQVKIVLKEEHIKHEIVSAIFTVQFFFFSYFFCFEVKADGSDGHVIYFPVKDNKKIFNQTLNEQQMLSNMNKNKHLALNCHNC